ncbi:DUF1801 domain-containing protein [Larkinella humicola]|uniref:YdhG-like domain-containing protein n=1 Tax=Larkinella humicola TaxID=2607654 RepID=A0A5N1JP60_9BACT|nr:DUF1801 domain-containing protein [Larkinella humicola]KAA9357416.1 hypothetical protein F0P93_06690 [Larkinella humicola]
MNKPTTIDRYIADFPAETRELLEQIRETIRKAAPEAEETINYGMPTFTLKGNLVHFAGYKNHIGFYPSPSGIEAFQERLAVYKGAKGSVQFPIDQPLPLDLIADIVKFRVSENRQLAEAKPKKKPAPRTPKLSDSEQVMEHIQKLDPKLGPLVESIRQLFLSTDPDIGERIKWNHPSFYYTGDMKPFDPKEYKRELAVFNLHKGKIMLVFPSGAKITDPSGLLEGTYKDGRRIVFFTTQEDIDAKAAALQAAIKEWLRLVEK